MADNTATKRASFSIGEDYMQKFNEISEITRRSMTEELRLMIDARATALGIVPVKPVDPKSSPRVMELA